LIFAIIQTKAAVAFCSNVFPFVSSLVLYAERVAQSLQLYSVGRNYFRELLMH
jgi:hypothetical protein